jgi:drug/metabolite transporter (DMT)-like permease
LLGYIAAIGAAAAWAFGSILFKKIGDQVDAIGLNLAKCIIGLVYLGAILLFVGTKPIEGRDFLLLGISGLLGIALGDTFFFKALVLLGPRLTLLLSALGPVATVILAIVFLNERPSLVALAGMITTFTGIFIVTWGEAPVTQEAKAIKASGIFYSILSILVISGSIIFAKIAIVSVPVLPAPFKDFSLLRLIFLSVFVVVFGGFVLFLAALKYIDASIATVLESTTPLWILPMSAFFLKEKIRPIEIFGAILAVFGIALIFLS